MADHDYTAGDNVPVEDEAASFDPEKFMIGGKTRTTIDPDQIGGDLPPGDYLVKVTGFAGMKNYTKDTFLNGKPVRYNAVGAMMTLADTAGAGTVSQFVLFPPNDGRDAIAYYEGTNASGKAKGFLAQQFVKIVEALMPGGKGWKVYPDGSRELTPFAAAIGNWKGCKAWVTVEPGKEQLDPITGEPKCDKDGNPYPIRNSVKLFTFRPDVGKIPAPPTASNGASKPATRAAKKTEPEMQTAGLDI